MRQQDRPVGLGAAVTGSLPPGSAIPSSVGQRFAKGLAGNQTWMTPATWSTHGISTGMPELTTTTVLGLAAATRLTSSSWRPGSTSVSLS